MTDLLIAASMPGAGCRPARTFVTISSLQDGLAPGPEAVAAVLEDIRLRVQVAQ